MTSALQLFRRAANVLARLEDAVVFNGQADAGQGPRAAARSPASRPSGRSSAGSRREACLAADADLGGPRADHHHGFGGWRNRW